MTPIVETLRTLHRIHQQLRELRDRLDRGPRQLKARESNIVRLEEEWADFNKQGKAVRVQADQKELQLKAGEAKVVDLKSKLNAAASNREYQALLEQIAGNEMTNSVLSDEILELLERVDGVKQSVADASARLERAKADLDKCRDAIRNEQRLVEADLARLNDELKQTEARLPHDVRDIYLRTTAAKGDDAMATVENETCTGCFQHLTANRFNELIMGRLVLCQTCGRLLYLAENAASRSPQK